jgi:hypothetical protein
MEWQVSMKRGESARYVAVANHHPELDIHVLISSGNTVSRQEIHLCTTQQTKRLGM